MRKTRESAWNTQFEHHQGSLTLLLLLFLFLLLDKKGSKFCFTYVHTLAKYSSGRKSFFNPPGISDAPEICMGDDNGI